MADISNSIRYWIKAYKNPTLMMGIITKKVNKVGIIFRINILMALLMVMTSLLNYVLSIEPYTGSVLQLLPDQPNSYYLVQAIYTIPWTILMWIMIAGVIYLVSIMGKSASRRFFFDDALVIATFGWVLPWLILIWIPETLIYPITGVLLPDVGELLRHYVFFGIWQTFIITIGVNQIFNVKGIKGVMIGLLSAGIFGVMVYVFIR